jgi:EsV-1-7 cysteine-rich motif
MKCKECGKDNATYALPGEKIFFCGKHKTKDMLNIYAKKCAGNDDGEPCSKRPTYGNVHRKPVYCKKHKEPDMVDVMNVRCVEEGCTKQPNFNLPGKKAMYCKGHASADMVDVKNQQCSQEGCILQPAYGFKGKKQVYCVSHKEDGMIDLKNIWCGKCDTIASYGLPGGKPVFCVNHMTTDMINVRYTPCLHEGCMKQPSYGHPVGGKITHCSEHASPEMVDMLHQKCAHPQGCLKNPSFNIDGKTPRFCAGHAQPDMVNVLEKRCEVDGCMKRARFNYEGMLTAFCREHAMSSMIDLVTRRCKMCPTTVSNDKYKGYCLRCFIHTFPNIKISRRYKIKERRIHDFLEEQYGGTSFTNVKTIDGGCSRRRPDWFFECFSHTIIVECDENQHEAYDTTCEVQRINELYTDLAYRPIVFIRFNPDEYTDSRGSKIESSFKYHSKLDVPVIRYEPEWRARLKALKEQIDYHKTHVPTEPVRVVSMFFDGHGSK